MHSSLLCVASVCAELRPANEQIILGFMSLNWILLLAIGLIVGVFSGLMGVGGGIILIPALMFALGYAQHEANGTSLVAMLLPVGGLGVWQYYKAGYIQSSHIKIGLIIAVGIFLGTFFGARLANVLSDRNLKRGFAVILLVVATKLFYDTRN